MAKRVLTVLTVLIATGMVFAEWQPVGNGTGGADVTILTQSSAGTTFEVNLPGIEVTDVTVDGQGYAQLSIPGDVMAVIEEGKPQVPKVSVMLAIPTGARVSARATVLETAVLDIDNVYPLQAPLVDGQEQGPLQVDLGFYTQDVSYPGYEVKVVETGTWRDLGIANLQVYPVQVNPAQGKVTVATKIRVEVDYSGGSYPRTVSLRMLRAQANFIDNFSELGLEPETDYTDGTRYLVFCHNNYASNAWLHDSLLGWVKQRGYDVRVVTKSSFTSTEIKDSVSTEYGRHTPAVLEFVLLVGEYAEVPMGAMPGVSKSDFFYSELTGDNYPELNIARFSPNSTGDLDNQVQKALKYQREPPATNDWLTKLNLVAHKQQYPGKYSACIRGIYNMPKSYYDYDCDTIMGQFLGNPAVATATNNGTGILIYRGHGHYDRWDNWGTTGSWNNSSVNSLTNGDLTPVTYHFACYSGDISQSTCHIEAWMRKYPGGSVSALSATQPSLTYPNHGQCSTVVRATADTWTIPTTVFSAPTFSVSGVMAFMDAYIAKFWGGDYLKNIYMYLTLGDPAMPVWSGGMPQTPVVTYPDSIPLGAYNLNVTVMVGGQPVEGALVCAWKDGDFYVAERSDAGGMASLAVNAGVPGEVLITVSEGHAQHSVGGATHTPIFPHEGTTMAGGGGNPQPNMRYVGNVVDDASGNNNGRFDPDETADIIVTVRNAGNATAEGLTGLLVSGNALFNITDPNSNFGDVPAGSTVTNNADRFTAHASSSIPPGTRVPCTLKLHSTEWGDWQFTFTLQVGEPPMPPQYMITLDTGVVRLSVCGIGSIGYDEPPSADLGMGFQVPKNTSSTLYFGGLMAGNGPGYLVDHHFSQPANSGTNTDWQMTDSFRYMVPPVPADVHWRGEMSDGGHPSSKGLDVVWDWYMNSDPGYDDWAIADMEFTNNGGSAINGLYIGFIGDFDIATSNTNIAASSEPQRSIWMRSASSANPTAGFVVLRPHAFGNLTAVDHATQVYPDSCMTDGQKWRHLDGTIAMRQSNRSYDWSVVASAGPFDLPVGGIVRTAFAVVGGNSEANFADNADSAQSWYDANLLGIVEQPPRIATRERPFFLSPNPFSRGTYVHYFTPLGGPVELLAYDATGRVAEQVSFDADKGSGSFYWQPKGLARGIYFLKVRSGDAESVAKVLLLD